MPPHPRALAHQSRRLCSAIAAGEASVAGEGFIFSLFFSLLCVALLLMELSVHQDPPSRHSGAATLFAGAPLEPPPTLITIVAALSSHVDIFEASLCVSKTVPLFFLFLALSIDPPSSPVRLIRPLPALAVVDAQVSLLTP
jgi:hypothetical protein